MADQVVLETILGPMRGKKITLPAKVEVVLGRAWECALRFPDDEAHQTISRRHCRLKVDLPHVSIRDLGSLNGTWVNGQVIGQREADGTTDMARSFDSPDYRLKPGDKVQLGSTTLTLQFSVLVQCAKCQKEIQTPDDPARLPQNRVLLCPSCQANEDKTMIMGEELSSPGLHDLAAVEKTMLVSAEQPVPATGFCLSCGRRLGKGAEIKPGGGFLCDSCRAIPRALVETLLDQAEKGTPDLASLKGMRLVKELGQGSYGAVYLVKRGQKEPMVALKILLPEAAVNPWVRDSFLREVDIQRDLNHPNVVRLFESGSYQGIFFYTMEYCDRGSLAMLTSQRGGTLPLDEAMTLIGHALDGLDYIHNVDISRVRLAGGQVGRSKGLVHRDLKPANVFLSSAGADLTAKIADVGVGKAFDMAGLSGMTRTGIVAGSPVAMPRQQVINFKFAKPEVDVWALAATLYITLTGKYPRDFPPGQDPFLIVLKTQPVPIRERSKAIPPNLAKVIDLALRDNPEIIFKTAAGLKQALLEAYGSL